jgi:hypothetical protein
MQPSQRSTRELIFCISKRFKKKKISKIIFFLQIKLENGAFKLERPYMYIENKIVSEWSYCG